MRAAAAISSRADPALLRSAACLLFLTAQTQAVPPAWSSAVALTPDAYVAELDRLATFLSDAGAGDAERASSGIAPRWIVDTGSERVAVDMRWLVAALRDARTATAWPAASERLRRRLLTLRAHATEAMADAPAEPTHAALRAAVEDVLARPEFGQHAGGGWREALQRWIVEWIDSLLRGLGLADVDGRRLAVGLAWMAGLAALAGLGLWIARMLTSGSPAVAYRLAPDARRTLSARDWARRATAALGGGDPREAVRCAYNGALRRLEEEGAWRVDQARTPREYLRLLRSDDARGEPMRDLTGLFERVWYGNQPVGTEDETRVSASLERLGCLHAGDRPT